MTTDPVLAPVAEGKSVPTWALHWVGYEFQDVDSCVVPSCVACRLQHSVVVKLPRAGCCNGHHKSVLRTVVVDSMRPALAASELLAMLPSSRVDRDS